MRSRETATRQSGAWALLLASAALVAPACGSDDGAKGLSSGGKSSASKGGSAGAQQGGKAGASTLGGRGSISGAGGVGDGDGGEHATGGDAPTAGASSSSGGNGAAGSGSGGSSSGGALGVGGDGGSGGANQCVVMADPCVVGENTCCKDAACYDSGNGSGAFCTRRCREHSDCDSSEPGCCAPLAENGALICVPSSLCPP